ncbi:MAG: shikimate kinase [Sediminicola sp.]|jgi:shikimate kinase
MKIVLIGYMGSGKSTVGIELGAVLGCKFIDLDNYIEFLEDKPISKIFKEKGEIYFRKLENRILKDLMSSENNVIISTGGGTPCYGNTMEFLKREEETVTIYLKTSLTVLGDRLFAERENRPLIAHIDDKAILIDFISKHLFERSFYYNQAKLKIDTENASVGRIIEKIVSSLF